MAHLDGYCGPEPSKIISDVLKRRSGEAPGGYPVYRLVWSEHVFERIGGEWNDWSDEVAVEDRGRISDLVDAQGNPVPIARPTRTVVEIRTIPTYCGEEIQGWFLERWFPAHLFGSPEEHYADVVPGSNIPRRGPYPERGKYMTLTGPFPEEPSIDFLQDFISSRQQWFDSVRSQDIEAYVKNRVYEQQKAMDKKRKDTRNENLARIKELTKNILYGSSLAAGRLRNKAAEMAGIRSHMGN